MARDPERDILKNPTPTEGVTKKTVDGVFTALKIGNGFISLLAGLLAAILILYSGYVLYDSFTTEYQAYTATWDLLKYKPAVMAAGEPSDGAKELAAINEDYRAWLTIYDTTIDYPVVQGENDLYYASHDVYRDTSLTGAIYLAAANSKDLSDSYNLVYGHHMDNGAMFGSLDRFGDSDYFHAHQEGIIITEKGAYDIILFAAVTTDAYESRIYQAGNEAGEVISFLTGDLSGSTGVGTKILVFDQEAAENASKVIALSTCADAETNGRLVVFGKMTPHETAEPTEEPTEKPTDKPTEEPTEKPTDKPTEKPTEKPTDKPTEEPTEKPADNPTEEPTEKPADNPTYKPTGKPADKPTDKPTGRPAVTPAPHKTPEETYTTPAGEDVRLTVYFLLDGEEVFPAEVFLYTAGEKYHVVAPQYPGYAPDREIIEGTITESFTVYVRYTPKTYRMTVRYVFPDGTKAAESVSTELAAGETYGIYSPVIEGYRAVQLKISGTKAGRDEEYTVVYVPEGGYTNLVTIDDYETPTCLETTYVQIGICFE